MASGTLKAAVALLAVSAIGMGGWHWATHWRPSPERYPLQGVDLPADAPALEWGSVRAGGADFGYLVATRSTSARAPAFEANWTALPEAGLRRGAVHLYSVCESADAQANAFNVVVPRATDALPAAVDVDLRNDCPDRPSAKALAADLSRFVRIVEAHTGKPMLLRVSRASEREYKLVAALDRPVWVIGNIFRPGYAPRPWRMWRASDMRRIDGVDRPLNWDVVAP